jgi:2-haloacid dehalogenase
MEAVVFDAMGTLFDLSALDSRFEAIGGTSATRDAWYERLLDTSKSLTLADRFEPFPKLALSTLRTTLASHGLDPADADEIVEAVGEVPAYPDARAALARLAAAGLTVVVLTNGDAGQTGGLLERSGLDRLVADVFTAAEVEAYKPHPAPYRHACESLGIEPAQAVLVAAHAWDVVGAQSAGYEAIWVDRTERCWPLPGGEPSRRAHDLEEAAALVSTTSRRAGPALAPPRPSRRARTR